jgi:cytochrome d ubiquinol oxidase subunit II
MPNTADRQDRTFSWRLSQQASRWTSVGTLVLLPVILIYNGWSYWVFRGKVRNDFGYH